MEEDSRASPPERQCEHPGDFSTSNNKLHRLAPGIFHHYRNSPPYDGDAAASALLRAAVEKMIMMMADHHRVFAENSANRDPTHSRLLPANSFECVGSRFTEHTPLELPPEHPEWPGLWIPVQQHNSLPGDSFHCKRECEHGRRETGCQSPAGGPNANTLKAFAERREVVCDLFEIEDCGDVVMVRDYAHLCAKHMRSASHRCIVEKRVTFQIFV